ncbi:membrane protein containing Signal transduction histidine kinase/GGDEF domain [Sulfurimonas gotlandica GD1]|uniref:Membrane protein containing Signal transduction histidine kinase/GGDEF domain n=1 Tax=Sulfurimonas gotlandica (strain DSM 19862 / JCM 16533 / GD1) TaxID=929558 RepID=B6BH41_SULGG|nr:LapD/MoxY N-terminal periplasmic domain-containing protein [Sulfurimonas gotlandica]EDZ63478.1 diguanylate cyclase/phosphodiesterase, putative [Sulfurimonas gotlandica GD1]EHP29830.1 membrane protein containing Signal transduction histidine kinase/GGDEF domain [Sulfurimonas gotlandica GD1]
MTLFKQIALMLSTFLIIILTTVLVLNFKSANESVRDRLYTDAKNTASSLSLSLGTSQGDISIMTTMINASFDSGYYRYITLVDIENNLIYNREVEQKIIDVPQWFIDALSITAPVASANVSAGWSQVGVLNVQSDAGYAYKQLYTILINLLISFGIIAVIGLAILNLLLVIILKPLKEVQKQAEAVTRNEFIIQDNIPYTKEFKDVVLGMNNMVSKVKAMFDKGNEELKRQKELEYIDKATKLRNRKYLIDKLPEYLKIDATSKGGINMMIALSGIIEANEKIGHQQVDKFFLAIANIFDAHASNYDNSIVARMNGTEFSILLPDCSDKEGINLAKGIYSSCKKIAKGFNLDSSETFISLGLYSYNYKENIGQLLSHSDNALAQAKFSEDNIYLAKAEDTVEVMGKEAWRKIINDAIEKNSFNFVSWTAVDAKMRKIAHNVLSLTLKVDKDTTYYYGQFMAPANQAGLSFKIYENVLNMMFKTPDMRLKGSACSLRLPYDYLTLEGTYENMSNIFSIYASDLPFKLIIEMPDKLVRQNSVLIKKYKALFEKYNIDMGVFEFIGESVDYQYLQDLRPVYIKGETDYFLSQSDQALSALRLITDTVGISLIAAGVMDMETLNKLHEKDIHIIQGRATEMIELV